MKRQVILGNFVALALVILISFNTSCGEEDSGNLVYLQAVKSDSVYVMAESQSSDPLTVEYGPTISYGSSATTVSTMPTTGGTFIHRIALTGLTPDTTYYYRSESHRNSFNTAVNSGTSFRFAWMSDCQTKATHDRIAALILSAAPRFSLYGGDICEHGASYDKYKDEFFRPNQVALAAHVPFFNATGNHETWGTNTKAFTQAPASASGNQGYYSFDYGDLHVVVMNFMDEGGYTTGSTQYNFIASDLAATTKPWKIVICHIPAYASDGEDEDMIALTTNVFEPSGVDLVVAGHHHFYQRNFVNNIYHLIIGSVGAPLHNPGPVKGYTQVSLKSYCWAIFDLTPTSLQIHVYNENGTEIDSLSLSK
jgi:acid phosphatase type 7